MANTIHEEPNKSKAEDLPELHTYEYVNYKPKYKGPNVIVFIFVHCLALYGLYLFTMYGSWKTFFWVLFVTFLAGEGTTLGAHRLFTHRSFKAHPAVRCALVICHTLGGQFSLHTWVRDHRLHHKYSDTDGDPHNATRGFFYSHIGWLLTKKHPAVIANGKILDLSDIESDPFIMLQKKYFLPLFAVVSVAIPVAVPIYYWNETFSTSLFFGFFYRYVSSLHLTFLINSAGHMFGNRPYDKTIPPSDALWMALLTYGKGWHNYHHIFPTDYRTSELGVPFNLTTTIIDMLAYVGLVYDRRSIPDHLIKRRMKKTGDGYSYE